MKKIILWAIPALMALVGCQNEVSVTESSTATPVIFTQSATVRVVGSQWSAGDSVGVFMSSSTGTAALTSTSMNVPYVTTLGNGSFTPAPNPLYYPTSGEAVDFYAYYPYSASRVSGHTYNIDLTAADATPDFLYSNNVKGWTASSQAGSLNFTRQLAALELNITTDVALAATDSMRVSVSGLSTRAGFDLIAGTLSVTSGSEAVYTVKASGGGTAFKAVIPVMPGADASAATLTFSTLSGKTKTATLPAGISFVAGNSVQLSVNASGLASGDTSNVTAEYLSWRETPVITTEQLSANRYVIHYMPENASARNYSMLYSPTYKIAYWVAYPLTSNMYGTVSRTDDWEYDPSVPQSEQADLSSAYATSGYDRGHQLPSADRTATTVANRTTFYYTNMTPQVSRLNQGVWANLEGKVRAWASGTDTLFVVTGAMPTTATNTTISYAYDRRGTAVAIPKYYFKALARKQQGVFYTIAFKFDNVTPTSTDYWQYTLSVADLEQMTGFTFFPSLDASVKASYDTNMWQ